MVRSIRNQKGFSLVELMVVVAIIGILSAIAIPQINKYMARARQTEAKTNLSAVYTSNKAFFAEYNIYDSRFQVIGYLPEGKLRYNVGWQSNDGQCNLSEYGYSGGGSTGNVPTNSRTLCTGTVDSSGSLTGGNCMMLEDGKQDLQHSELSCADKRFIAAAAGKISSSTSIDRWTIDQTKIMNNRNDGTQ